MDAVFFKLIRENGEDIRENLFTVDDLDIVPNTGDEIHFPWKEVVHHAVVKQVRYICRKIITKIDLQTRESRIGHIIFVEIQLEII